MKVVVGTWFKLPRLGIDAFSALMKVGVKYEKGMGFMLTPETNMSAATRTIERAIDERVELSVRCFICNVDACPNCTFQATCDRGVVSPMCLCDEHSSSGDAFEVYSRNFEAALAE